MDSVMGERTCEHCGEPLAADADVRRRYCDRRCMEKARSDRASRFRISTSTTQPTGFCQYAECGKPLLAGANPQRKYCDVACRRRAGNRATHLARRQGAEADRPQACLECGADLGRAWSYFDPFCDKHCRWAYRLREGVVPPTKACRICGEIKSLEDFYLHKNGRSKDGRQADCKSCRKVAVKASYERRLEVDPEAVRARARRYYVEHADEIRVYAREYGRQWRSTPHARALEANKALARTARKLERFVEDVDRRVLFERDEGLCGICGKPVDPDDFHVDHVVPFARGGEHSYANTQVAHPFCNMSKQDHDQVAYLERLAAEEGHRCES